MRPPSQPELYRPRLTYPEMTYGEMLDRPTLLYPEREAIGFKDVSLTFRELEGLVNAFANALRGLGIGRGDRVCLFMTNRPEYVVAFYALARLGAVSSPMNPSYKGGRLSARRRPGGGGGGAAGPAADRAGRAR